MNFRIGRLPLPQMALSQVQSACNNQEQSGCPATEKAKLSPLAGRRGQVPAWSQYCRDRCAIDRLNRNHESIAALGDRLDHVRFPDVVLEQAPQFGDGTLE